MHALRAVPLFLLACLTAVTPPAAAQTDDTRLLRYPDIHKDQVVFVYAGDLYIASTNGGAATRLTSHEGTELYPKFSPDGTQVAFSAQYNGTRQVYVMPAEGGTPRQLTSGDFNHDGTLSFTPDGSEILFSANRNADWEMQSREADIFAVTVGSGAMRQVTSAPGVESHPQVSPDGKSIAFLKTSNAREPFVPTDVFFMSADGSGSRNLTEGLDRRAGDPQWLSNGEIAYTFQNRGENHIGVVDRAGNRRVAVEGIGGTTVGRPYVSGSFDAGAGGALVYTKGSATRPADLYASARRRKTRLTELNEDLLAHRDLGELREFTYASSLDGLEIQGWMITPPGYAEGQRYPLIIEIHGGPHLAYGPHFSAELQRMAAAGYVVVYDNHRGSIGYGSEFANLLKYKYSSPDDFADHMSAVDWAIANGFADESNLFIADTF